MPRGLGFGFESINCFLGASLPGLWYPWGKIAGADFSEIPM